MSRSHDEVTSKQDMVETWLKNSQLRTSNEPAYYPGECSVGYESCAAH